MLICELDVYSSTQKARSELYVQKLLSYEPRHDKANKMSVRPAKTQISLGIRPVWSESSLYAQWVAKDPSFLHADSEDSDQTGRTPRLNWVFAGRTLILLVLSCRGSYNYLLVVQTCALSPIIKLRSKIYRYKINWQEIVPFKHGVHELDNI